MRADRWRVRVHPDATSFLGRAETWLVASEAENNLLLGLARRSPDAGQGFEPPFLWGTLEDRSGELAGCVFRTPPHKVGLTRLPLDAIPAVVDAVAKLYPSIPGVLGPDPEAERFARSWAERHGLSVRAGMRQRIHVLERVDPPARRPPGALRRPLDSELELLTHWFEAFAAETHVLVGQVGSSVRRLHAASDLHVWDHDGPACMAAVSARTPRGARIGWVYTPPERRGRGYATAAVADLSEICLRAGLRHLFLYTDLANPVSNSIYRRIGYRPVIDVTDHVFIAAAVSGTAGSDG